MAILSIIMDLPGEIGMVPRRGKMVTTDSLATITTAGYLNSFTLQGQVIEPTDILDVVYLYNAQTNTGTYDQFVITMSNGIITMVPDVSAGNVLLPVVSGDFATFNGTLGQIKDSGYLPSNAAKTTVVMATGAVTANHIATYTDTAGTVGQDAATAINAGNIQAGLSGTAGTVGSFPSAATSGELILAAVTNSSGNFNTTISNAAAVGQSQVISVPDSGATTANFIISKSGGAQHITAGNLQVDAGSFISGLSAGGFNGTIQLFPTTTANGSLNLTAANAGANFASTISNGTMGQATVYTLPDPGAAAANFIVSKNAATQHITTGNLQIDAGSLISGLSTGGFVGAVQLFPTTTTTGSLTWQATPNTGNTATVFTTAAYGQASTITYPDPAVAAARGVLAPNALVSGNLISASGTAGLIQDAGIIAANIQINTVTITLNQAAVQGAFGVPFQIVATPGANKVIIPTEMTLYTNFQTSAFAGGGVAIIQYDNTIHGAGTNALAATIPAAEVTAAASQIYNLGPTSATVLTGITNKGIFFSNQTGAFTGGSASSTLVITLSYYVITATV